MASWAAQRRFKGFLWVDDHLRLGTSRGLHSSKDLLLPGSLGAPGPDPMVQCVTWSFCDQQLAEWAQFLFRVCAACCFLKELDPVSGSLGLCDFEWVCLTSRPRLQLPSTAPRKERQVPSQGSSVSTPLPCEVICEADRWTVIEDTAYCTSCLSLGSSVRAYVSCEEEEVTFRKVEDTFGKDQIPVSILGSLIAKNSYWTNHLTRNPYGVKFSHSRVSLSVGGAHDL